MSSYVEDLAAWKRRGTGVVDDWADEVRRAKEDGHISCWQCGHKIDPEEHDEQGCHAFDSMLPDENFPNGCPCPERFTLGDILMIWSNYEKSPYVIGGTVYYYGNPQDVGTVRRINFTTGAVYVEWATGTKFMWIEDPMVDLSEIPG